MSIESVGWRLRSGARGGEPESRRLGKLAGVVALTWIWWRPALLVPGLLALPSAGCCDCAGEFNTIRVGSDTPMASLDVSGEACGEPTCDYSPPEASGGCFEFKLSTVKAGSCQLTATATDGRTAATDVTVTLSRQTCCGNMYTIGRHELQDESDSVLITFSGAATDAAMADGGS